MNTYSIFRSVGVAVTLCALVNPAFADEDGKVKSTGLIEQTATISGSIGMLQAGAANRQATNLVAGKSIDVTGVTQKTEGNSLTMAQMGIASSQAVNAVVADSPESGAMQALSGLNFVGNIASKVTDILKKGN